MLEREFKPESSQFSNTISVSRNVKFSVYIFIDFFWKVVILLLSGTYLESNFIVGDARSGSTDLKSIVTDFFDEF